MPVPVTRQFNSATGSRLPRATRGNGPVTPEEGGSSSRRPVHATGMDNVNPSDLSSVILHESVDATEPVDWIRHSTRHLREFACHQTPAQMAERISVEINDSTVFTSEYLRVNENDDQGQPEDNSGLELLDDIPTMLRWAEESLRQQGLSKGEYEENIPMMLIMLANNFYEAGKIYENAVLTRAAANARDRGDTVIRIEDFEFGVDFSMRHNIGNFLGLNSRVDETLEKMRLEGIRLQEERQEERKKNKKLAEDEKKTKTQRKKKTQAQKKRKVDVSTTKSSVKESGLTPGNSETGTTEATGLSTPGSRGGRDGNKEMPSARPPQSKVNFTREASNRGGGVN